MPTGPHETRSKCHINSAKIETIHNTGADSPCAVGTGLVIDHGRAECSVAGRIFSLLHGDLCWRRFSIAFRF